MSARSLAIAIWSVGGVLALLVQAIVRLSPRAIEPVLDGSLTLMSTLAYVAAIVFMAYSEGYRGFQRSFSPRVVARALHLAERRDAPTWLIVLAPIYGMGLIHASRRRLIGSWVLLLGVIGLIVAVSQLDQPWRGAIDAGVVVGLSWGAIATIVVLVRALRGERPDVDPNLPEPV